MQVEALRKNMLRLIGVREFAEEAKFANPCVSFALPEVVCMFCNHCRDIDLCRDSARAGNWQCPECRHEYSKNNIENTLIGTFACVRVGVLVWILGA